MSSAVGPSRDLNVLESLAWAGILGTSQVARLHFPSRRTAERRLRALLDQGLVRSCLQNGHLHRDNVHVLTPLGAERLVEERSMDPKTVRARRVPRPQKLGHVLAVRDVFVEFKLAAAQGKVQLRDFVFEEDLVRLPAFKETGIIPDAIALVGTKARVVAIAIEVDLGTETTGTLRAKFERYRRRKPMAVAVGAASVELLVLAPHPSRSKTVQRVLDEAGVEAWILLGAEMQEKLARLNAESPDDRHAFVPLR